MRSRSSTCAAVAALALSLDLVAMASASPDGAGGRLEIGETTVDAGHVEQGAKAHHDFVVKNVGSGPLRIDPRPGAGCGADVSRTLAPGESDRLSIWIDTARHAGEMSRSLLLFTDDPAARSLILRLLVTVDVAVRVEPSDRVRIEGWLGETLEGSVTLSATGGEIFDVLSAEEGGPGYRVNIEPLAGFGTSAEGRCAPASGASAYLVTISVDPEVAGWTPSAEVVLKTTHPKAPVIPISAYVRLHTDLEVDPDSVVMSRAALDRDPAQRHRVTLRKPRGTPILITSLETSQEGIRADLVTVVPGREYAMDVVANGALPPFGTLASITLHTDNRQHPDVVVNVYVMQ